jgi:hypothetical protein
MRKQERKGGGPASSANYFAKGGHFSRIQSRSGPDSRTSSETLIRRAGDGRFSRDSTFARAFVRARVRPGLSARNLACANDRGAYDDRMSRRKEGPRDAREC